MAKKQSGLGKGLDALFMDNAVSSVESYNKVGITFRYKVKLRNLEYLKKIIRKKNKIVIQSKNYKIETEKMPIRLLISLNERISTLMIKYKKDKNEKNNKIIIYLHKVL